jgi:CheY-like chemotaxis protein
MRYALTFPTLTTQLSLSRTQRMTPVYTEMKSSGSPWGCRLPPGHEVFVAGGGRQLVELCRRVRPDLIITDLQMPQLDGLAALQQVGQELSPAGR